MLQCVAVIRSVYYGSVAQLLQCAAASCSVLQRVAGVAMCFSVLQCIAVCCSVSQSHGVERLFQLCVAV